jgi:hemolysin (HlyC) family protein
MTDITHPTKPQRRWLERFVHFLSGEPRDREALVDVLREAEQREIVDADALAMMESVLLLSQLRVRDIMIPRSQMVAIQENDPLPTIFATVTKHGHSRFPVLGDHRDTMIGILHAKDLLNYDPTQPESFDLSDIIRPAVVVPESKSLDTLLNDFRQNRNHMAIVVDEYGSVAGFVTIEDVLEQIVGDIADEFDIDEDAFVKQHPDGRYIIKAHMPIHEFNEYFHESFDESEFDTVGGLVTHEFGYVPKRGEQIRLGRYQFSVLNGTQRRICLLQGVLVSE